MKVDPNLENDVAAFWALLFEMVADAEKRLAAHMARHQLTPPQFFVLKTLFEHGGSCRIGQIATEHHLTNATMTGLVSRLESMRPPLVTRERSESDARSVNVLLTPAGLQRFMDVQQGLMDQARVMLGMLSPEERRETLEKMQFYFRMLVEQFPVDEQGPEVS